MISWPTVEKKYGKNGTIVCSECLERVDTRDAYDVEFKVYCWFCVAEAK